MAEMAIAFVASGSPKAQEALASLKARYDNVEPDEASMIVALGGDGFVLESLHRHMHLGVPIYGMNRGSVGFLMNTYNEDDLPERLAEAHKQELRPLRMIVTGQGNQKAEALAINEVSLFRETRQAAKIEISVDGKVRMEELICDGVMVSTPAGSTAYNLSAHGPIVPIGGRLLALTPISAFRPRRWRGALMPDKARIRFRIHEPAKRPVSAVADFTEIRDVAEVEVISDRKHRPSILFDPEHSLEERIIKEQFIS